MKKVTFLLFVLSVIGFAQSPITQVVEKWYLIGNSAQGDTFSALSPARNTSGAIFANYALLGARLTSNDSTHLYIAVDRKLSSTWAAFDSVLIHPATGAAADTFWTLRSNTVEKFHAFGAQYRFRLNFLSGCASQSQATKPRVTLWIEGVKQ
jgi:hypothetical protein